MHNVAAMWLWGGSAQAADLTVWHAYRGDEARAIDEAAAQWGSEHDAQVEVVAVPFGAFDAKIETAVPRGNGPDVFLAAHGNLGKWRAMGIVRPLEGRLDEHRAATVAALQADGQVWGAPLAFKSVVLLYDPTLVDEPPTTTGELVAQARALTGGGRYGLAYQAAEPYFHGVWQHAFGGRALDTDGAHLDGEAQVAALAFSRRLAVESGIAPPQPTAELIARLYGEGNAAFVISGPWFVAETDRPIAAAPLPFVDEAGAPAQPYLTVDAAFVAQPAANGPGATAFAAWLSGPVGAELRQRVGRQAVSHLAIEPDDPLLEVLAAQAEAAVPIPSDPDIQAAFEAQARALRDVLRGAASPQVAARGAQETFRILARPPPPPVAAWPYVLLMALVGLAATAFALAPLRDPAARAQVWRHRFHYGWLVPSGATLLGLLVVPFLTGAAVSLLAHHRGEWSFVGLAHFADILLARDWPVTSPLSFVYTLGVTLLWTVTNLALHVGLGVALAMVLREPWIRLRGVWRALLIVPWAVPNYITALIWKGMFHAQYGAINALLGAVMLRDGPLELDWFGSFAMAFGANLATNTWLGFPFMMVVTLGALQSIPRQLEEAAMLDGASWWFRLRHTIWPMLRPALLPAVILGSVWTFNMFNVVFLVSQGEPNSSTEILISEAYRWAFSRGNRYGYAAAYAVLIFFVLVIYSRGANRLVGRRVL
ncbi:MAG: extracellular solute-binding protein [Myxococcales bacterium]|nr:extracellular solute-binding protein [Myxococcales bacterium]